MELIFGVVDFQDTTNVHRQEFRAEVVRKVLQLMLICLNLNN